MKYLQIISRPGKLISGAGILLILYGHLSRALGLYFFWESRSIGWDLFFVGLIFTLVSWRKDKKRNGKKAIGEGIGIGFLIFLLMGRALFYFGISRTDGCLAAKTFVLKNDSIRREIGTVGSMYIIPGGSYTSSTTDGVETGSAELELVVKGEKKFKDYLFYVDRPAGSGWQVEGIEERTGW